MVKLTFSAALSKDFVLSLDIYFFMFVFLMFVYEFLYLEMIYIHSYCCGGNTNKLRKKRVKINIEAQYTTLVDWTVLLRYGVRIIL